MVHGTKALFREDAYLKNAEAVVIGLTDDGGVILDQTIFYATSGGQPGDIGKFLRANGEQLNVAETVTGATKDEIVHKLEEGAPLPEIGEKLGISIDWERRYKLMQMHSACHLLSVICPYPVTGASVGENESRIDFDVSGNTFDKQEVTDQLMNLVNEDHPILTQWISEEELAANPSLIKSKNVRPPVGTGKIRLVVIGDNASVDSQPCGGTHVLKTTEIGSIHIGKIEKKGKENRRFRIRFGDMPN